MTRKRENEKSPSASGIRDNYRRGTAAEFLELVTWLLIKEQ
jgi:hypothetical protein